VLAGTYNPPTYAHLALAREAAARADEVLLVLPESLPHKQFDGVGLAQRLHLLHTLAADEGFSVGSTAGGLYLEMAEACAAAFPHAEIALVCGRDAAERILGWDYAEQGVLERLFALATLWVFARQGTITPPEPYASAIQCFPFEDELQALSATEVRRRIAAGEDWRHWVPISLHADVERLYRAVHCEARRDR
jgi:nicotinate-nucleotide adenylyltransferase